MSELKDSLEESSGDLESKLKSMPEFSTFPQGFSKFLPVNDTEIISQAMLSPFFKSSQFLNDKGNNVRIMSIGIPPKLNRSLRTTLRTDSDNSKAIKQGIIRIKVYKIDRLRPAIVYLPQIYLFEMNRFPTRIISNWKLDSFRGISTNTSDIPSKLMLSDGNILLHRDFSEAFPDQLYKSVLNYLEKRQIYKNHSVSFLLEEYLRWFTDCRFDETRYDKFSKLDSNLANIEDQYQRFIDVVKNNSNTSTGANVHASFLDNGSGQTYNLPVDTLPTYYFSSETNQYQAVSQKQFVIPMSDTLKSYFEYETFISNPDIYKRRISYFKKFDRVFNLLLDPDDFIVDNSMTDHNVISQLLKDGTILIVNNRESNSTATYRHRDTTPDEAAMDEYFVTIEPYDYVQEYVR